MGRGLRLRASEELKMAQSHVQRMAPVSPCRFHTFTSNPDTTCETDKCKEHQRTPVSSGPPSCDACTCTKCHSAVCCTASRVCAAAGGRSFGGDVDAMPFLAGPGPQRQFRPVSLAAAEQVGSLECRCGLSNTAFGLR